jgi:hypothetical protein
MPTLTREIIEAAVEGLEVKKLRIDRQLAELRAMLRGTSAAPVHDPSPDRPKRKISAAALQRMREGQQRRWAKVRGEAPALELGKPKRKMSAAGRKAIAAAQKKRWAAKKATKATT